MCRHLAGDVEEALTANTRDLTPNGQTRVLMTNLTAAQAPAHCFGGLYHQRWRVEEAFKRLKHRLHLEAVSGFS